MQSSFAGLDPEKLGLPDEQISVWLDVGKWQEAKDRSWSMHRTQANSGAFMAQIPEDLLRKWRGYECYQLAASRVGLDVPGENDLFARVQ
jgi:N-acetyl-1-D-myo-inositol-2-amino-2-deoxy-alpha-D-glucopyranoside deacetylase